ncbi:hypothetical protein ABUW04_21970 [Streptacidiphilus sp. N1-10]|uniref:Uncharacterized protein n=1 Tax=Streptacidiphilus jeojiensis TaxID=3229225 RepID=A0ABV6XSM1_9ACTN
MDSETEPDARADGDAAGYCATGEPAAPTALVAVTAGQPVADCVLCGEPSEHPADAPGAPLCALCEWQQAQRGACSG